MSNPMPLPISYDTLLQTVSVASLIIDAEQKIISCNDAFLDLLQTENDKILGYFLEDIFPQFAGRVADTKVSGNITVYSLELQYVISPLYEDNNLQGYLIQLSSLSEDARNIIRVTQLDTLRVVDDEVSRSLDIKQVMTLSLDAAILLSGADAGFVALNTGEPIEISHVAGAFDESTLGQSIYPEVGIVGRVLKTHEPELVLDVNSDPDYFLDLPDTQALMAFPLIAHNRLVGVMNLETFDAIRFNQSIFQFVRLLANRLAISLHNARLYQTVRTQLEDLYGLYEELRRAEDLKTDMIRIANHDLKNPLSIIRGYIDLMEIDAEQLPPDYLDAIPTMKRSLDRAYGILDEFLSLEAIAERTSGKKLHTFDLSELARHAISEFQPQMLKKQQKLTINLSSEEIPIKGDRAQIYEAVGNIIHNAIKYTPNSGQIHIELITTNTQDARFTVADTGFGIPEAHLAHIFEPFYRSDISETRNIDGSGLGLHLVKNIIERHGGKMIITSVYHEGSTFGFLLPIAVDD